MEDNLQKRKSDMLKYNVAHVLETRKNYGCYEDDNISESEQNEKANIAKYLNSKFDSMDEEELNLWLKKCLSLSDKKRLLLEYELKHYKSNPTSLITTSDFIKKAFSVLRRYHWKAGGFLIEDEEWTLHTSTSEDYEIRDYEVVFENSINNYDLDDTETQYYLDRLIKRIQGISKSVKVELRSHPDQFDDTVMWLLIYVTDIDAKKNSKKIDIKI